MSLTDDQADDARDHARLRPLFALIVVVEAITIAALYAFGRYFS
jgi:hypothetical protein